MKKPVVLVIRDGWGINKDSAQDKYNAIKLAKTPVSDQLTQTCPRTELAASGLDVGVPQGVIGNSEVGHQNIGAGRIVDQEIVRINKFFDSDEPHANEVLKEAFNRCKNGGGRLHLIGLLSDSGVHSMNTHLYKLLDLASKQEGIGEVLIHVITDGRDSPPKNGLGYVKELEAYCQKLGVGTIASICGRYWAMDRDLRWERTQKAYSCFTDPSLEVEKTPQQVIEEYYANPISKNQQGDEFIPAVALKSQNSANHRIICGDCVVFFNFRGDRPRQIVRSFVDASFNEFEREFIKDLYFCTLTDYQKGLCEHVILPKPPKMPDILGSVLSQEGIKQLRCAETEKYPHVTFFFNDYRDEAFEGEDRVIVNSPKDVATYDLKPSMSAQGVCDSVIQALHSKEYGFIVVNFANPDMVGHTGNLEATTAAVEVVDQCLGQILKAIDEVDAVAIITADHGNAEIMWNDATNTPHTQHTLNLVEAVIYGKGCEDLKLRDSGRLADIAPTVLDLLNIEQPSAMTGKSLII